MDELTTADLGILSRGIPSEPGYHEIDWTEQEIAAADAVFAKLRRLVGFAVTRDDVRYLKEIAEIYEFEEMAHLAAKLKALLPPKEGANG